MRNFTSYCNPEVDRLIDRKSAKPDREDASIWSGRSKGGWPIIFYPRGGTCMQPYVRGLVTMVNSNYNCYRMEDVWLNK